jgi:hypothetical protein
MTPIWKRVYLAAESSGQGYPFSPRTLTIKLGMFFLLILCSPRSLTVLQDFSFVYPPSLPFALCILAVPVLQMHLLLGFP